MNLLSKYTTELRFYLATLANVDENEDVSKVLSESWSKVFNFEFPIFEESHREELCKKILLHYYFREIGMETVGAWKVKLQSKMLEIMPYYNKLYQAIDNEFNLSVSREAFVEREYHGSYDFTGNTTGTNSGNVNMTSQDNTTNKFLDTPQGGLDGILDSDYLTNVSIDENDGTQATTSNSSNESNTKNVNNDEHSEVEHKYGNYDLLDNIVRYEQEIFNIDLRIINELNSLFMLLW